MGYIRTRANGQLAFVFMWKGKRHTKGLGTTDEQAAEQIRRDANEQLDRIRKGETALASQLLADGHSIIRNLAPSTKHAQKTSVFPEECEPLPIVLAVSDAPEGKTTKLIELASGCPNRGGKMAPRTQGGGFLATLRNSR